MKEKTINIIGFCFLIVEIIAGFLIIASMILNLVSLVFLNAAIMIVSYMLLFACSYIKKNEH